MLQGWVSLVMGMYAIVSAVIHLCFYQDIAFLPLSPRSSTSLFAHNCVWSMIHLLCVHFPRHHHLWTGRDMTRHALATLVFPSLVSLTTRSVVILLLYIHKLPSMVPSLVYQHLVAS